jgi:hypothetical protein
MKNTLNLLEELPDGNAPAGSPEEGVPFLFRATPRPRPGGRAVRSKANRERWQGILEDHPPDLETLRAEAARLHYILIQVQSERG